MDGAINDFFGKSVAICGTVAIAGAPGGPTAPLGGSWAYLFHAAHCAADVSGDATVGPADLAIILGNWGPVPPNDPIADLTGDGVVGADDLAIVLGNWGPCP